MIAKAGADAVVNYHKNSEGAKAVKRRSISLSAHMPEIYDGAYTPSKAGVIGLTRMLAMEWAEYGIRVDAISPGPIFFLTCQIADCKLWTIYNMQKPSGAFCQTKARCCADDG